MSDEDNKKISLPITGDTSVDGQQSDEQPDEDDALSRIDRHVSQNTVMLYMKGTPQQPMCGFSAKAASIVSSYGVPFETFNVLEDDEVRQGIKDYGDWPTIPQLYIEGELVGGSDIVAKMHQSGELNDMLTEAFEGSEQA